MPRKTIVWTRPGCGACTFTVRALTKAGVPHEVRNLDFFPKEAERLRAAGFQALPVVEPADARMEPWAGLKIEKIKELTDAEWP